MVGASGCGKSTLLALVRRLYLPERGRIFIGEVDISYVSLASLRQVVAAVPQHTHLLSGTVLENLVMGDVTPDMPRLMQVCREVGILEFIESLPQGFLTALTENGTNFSGGQRQRLAIARALYADAQVLLLDEPTSALDQRAERMLMELLIRLRERGCTIVVSSHTARVLEAADKTIDVTGLAAPSEDGTAFPALDSQYADTN